MVASLRFIQTLFKVDHPKNREKLAPPPSDRMAHHLQT